MKTETTQSVISRSPDIMSGAPVFAGTRVPVSVEKEVVDWYQAQGEELRALMSAALKIYAEAHREIRR